MKTDNELIAEFMGFECYESNGYRNYIFEEDNHRTHVDLWYDKDWNWLMPVVEKIEYIPISDDVNVRWDVCIYMKTCTIGMKGTVGTTKLEATYKAVVEFIKWYNLNK